MSMVGLKHLHNAGSYGARWRRISPVVEFLHAASDDPETSNSGKSKYLSGLIQSFTSPQESNLVSS